MPHSQEYDRLAAALAGQYAVERELGRGGMGVVLLARDLRLDRLVAIKTLPRHLADDPVIRERFLREARTAAALSHARIVPIHHAAEASGAAYFVMGYVDGGSAAQMLDPSDPRPVAASDVVPLLIDVAEALGYAHARGVVHRDIKAENILIDAASGRAMVTDFGIARLVESASMTATGTVLGTVQYMSPEQVNGDALDGRSDLYALGVLAFLLLSGRFPFVHESPSAVLVAHVNRPPPALRSVAPSVPADVAAIVDRLLRKEPAQRFENAEALIVALEAADVTSAAESAPAATRDDPARPAARLSSDEAHAVWERAALLQQMTGVHTPPPPSIAAAEQGGEPLTAGYRMDDVLAAAQEAGIERKFVERAIAERTPLVPGASRPPDAIVRDGAAMTEAPSFWIGARTRIEYEAVIDGELHGDDFEDVVDEIRRAFDEFGNASTVGRTITFLTNQPNQPGTSPRRLQVTVSVRAGRTTVRVFEDLRQTANGIVGGISGGVGGGVGGGAAGLIMGTTQNPFIAIPAMLGIATVAFVSSRLGVKKWSEKKQRDLRAATERVAQKVKELTVKGALPAAPSPRRLKR